MVASSCWCTGRGMCAGCDCCHACWSWVHQMTDWVSQGGGGMDRRTDGLCCAVRLAVELQLAMCGNSPQQLWQAGGPDLKVWIKFEECPTPYHIRMYTSVFLQSSWTSA
jgi:hypothetical protein